MLCLRIFQQSAAACKPMKECDRMKIIKRTVPLFLCFTFVLLSICPVRAERVRSVTVKNMDGADYFCLSDLEACSDISIDQTDQGVILTEDGLYLHLRADTVFIYRGNHIVGSMQKKPVLEDGQWYAPMDFYDHFLCGKDGAVPSLFHGTLFYAQEVLAALSGDGNAAFNQKLLASVRLPGSMGIKTPHLDMFRIFVNTPLTEFSPALSEEMLRCGFSNPDQMTYSDYVIVSGTQTLTSAGMASVVKTHPELKGTDPNTMTVAEYTTWEKNHGQQQYEETLSDAAKKFAAEKEIQLSDLGYLNRCFPGAYMDKSEEELKGVLTDYYQTDLQSIQEMCHPFADVTAEDWFFESVMSAVDEGWMNGTSKTTFSPNRVMSRGELVTILWRLEGKPVVNYKMRFADVPENRWYSEAVRWASGEKIVDGYGSTFGINDPITREQLASILWRYSKYKGVNVETKKDAALNFDDVQRISEYAVEAMQWACEAQLMQGNDGKLLPGHTATRAEAAAMLQRFSEYVDNWNNHV